ncbi:chorion peroxidase-like [Pomacea canaliculata]|uniref:chorion peroxidase-like n=1 Tax=Pomacea canaliculata TaxID=400727 RepID=UPI000D7310FE|nr:chorion peroxidase-like [Pomacea canaliculata]
MQIGQFLDHDISAIAVPTQENKPFKCCGVPANERHEECYPIDVPADDSTFNKCIEFIRSEPARYKNGSVMYPRRHENVITSFIDASMIYGSDLATVRKLRDKDGKGALLKTSFYKGRERLPRGDPNLASAKPPTATAPWLTVRKIIIAIWQNTVYGSFLPVILGPKTMDKYKLWTGKRMQFDPNVDPSLENAFATAAYRFGHSLVSNLLRIDKDYFLKDVFSDSTHIRENFELMCHGLVSWRNPAEDFDPLVVDSLTNHLFENKKKNRPGLDLSSINIQRGRDHGTAGINEYRKYFGKKPYVNFNQLNSAVELRSIYSHPDDIDLFTGGLCENRTEGAFVGETFAEILGMQFHDLKYGTSISLKPTIDVMDIRQSSSLPFLNTH